MTCMCTLSWMCIDCNLSNVKSKVIVSVTDLFIVSHDIVSHVKLYKKNRDVWENDSERNII